MSKWVLGLFVLAGFFVAGIVSVTLVFAADTSFGVGVDITGTSTPAPTPTPTTTPTAPSQVPPPGNGGVVPPGPSFDSEPPGNVSNVSFRREGSTVLLFWSNPSDADFQGVRIVRSDHFYPASVLDGETVFEGWASYTIDTGLAEGKTYYYTIFTKDTAGNYSSGALVLVPGGVLPPGPFLPAAPSELEQARIRALGLNDFVFAQGGRAARNADGIVLVAVYAPIEVSLLYEKTGGVAKLVTITIEDQEYAGHSATYIMNLSADGTRYQALVPAFTAVQQVPFFMSIINHNNTEIGRVPGIFSIRLSPEFAPRPILESPLRNLTPTSLASIIFLLIIIVILLNFALIKFLGIL